MQKPQFTIVTDSETATFAKFIVEPLPQGFGHTLGNSLRRVLYNSIPGAAITSINITGATHQFTTIPGIQEDVVQLVLALKQIRVSYTNASPAHITLSAKGIKAVTAGDFKADPGVEIANPDLVVAHLTDKNAKLEIDATVEAGFGYSPAEDRKSSTVGVIPMDATFTPVTRVNYTVEATRVGRVTNFDKLVLEVTTDGTVRPADALRTASETLVQYFSAIVSPNSDGSAVAGSAQARSSIGSAVSVEELDLPTRIANALQKAGFTTVADLLSTPRETLAKVKNLGGKSVKIIQVALSERGFEMTL